MMANGSNAIYIDIVEEIDAILSADGAVLASDVTGSLQSQSTLSGVSDIMLTFNDANLIDDCSFHPCVRYMLFEKDKIVSFVPPDGPFELMRYRVRLGGGSGGGGGSKSVSMGNLPIQVIPRISYGRFASGGGESDRADMTGRISLSVTARSISSLIYSSSRKGPLIVEDVSVVIPFPTLYKRLTFLRRLGRSSMTRRGRSPSGSLGN